LACSDKHIEKVFEMLKGQKGICFKGGLEARRITPKIAEGLRGLRIAELWLACDYPGALKPLKTSVEILKKAGFTRSHLHSYVLIGDDMAENESRLRQVYEIGCMPFAQLYQPRQELLTYKKEWKLFARKWSRPAIIRSMCEKGT